MEIGKTRRIFAPNQNNMDIKKLCNAAGIPFATLARELFPDHRYPEHALRYLVKAKSLSPEQIEVIERLSGKNMDEILSLMPTEVKPNGKKWSWKPTTHKSSFCKGTYRVDYSPELNTAYLFCNGELISDHILVSNMLLLKDFLQEIETLIASYEATKTDKQI